MGVKADATIALYSGLWYNISEMPKSWKSDYIIDHRNGSRTEIRYRRRLGSRNETSRMRIEYDANGNKREIWHEVLDRNGYLMHKDRKLPYP